MNATVLKTLGNDHFIFRIPVAAFYSCILSIPDVSGLLALDLRRLSSLKGRVVQGGHACLRLIERYDGGLVLGMKPRRPPHPVRPQG